MNGVAISRPSTSIYVLAAMVATLLGGLVSVQRLLPLAIGLGAFILLLTIPRRAVFVAIAVSLPYLYQFLPRASSVFTLVLVLLVLVDRIEAPKWLWPIVGLVGLMVLRGVLTPILGGVFLLTNVLTVVIPLLMAVLALQLFRSSSALIPLALVMLVGPTVTAAYEMITGVLTHPTVEGGRLSGGMSTPSELGVFAALIFATLWPVALERGKLAFVPVGMAAYCVIASGTRGALLAIVIPPVFAALVARRQAGKALRKGLGALVVAGLLFIPIATTSVERLSKAVSNGGTQFASHQTDTTLGVRAVAWEKLEGAFEKGGALAKLFGQGIGTSQRIIETNFATLHLPHNEYLRYLVDMGWVGLLYLVASLVIIAVLPLKDAIVNTRFMAPLTMVTALLILASTDNPLLYGQALVIPFVAVGLLSRESEARKEVGRKPSPFFGQLNSSKILRLGQGLS